MAEFNALKIFEASTFILSQEPPVCEAIFIHARPDDEGLMELAELFYKQGKAKLVVINGSEGEGLGSGKPGEAWSGKSVWQAQLKELGVSRVEYSRPAYHTKDENEAFVEFAKTKKIKKAIVIAPPYQILRAFLGMLKTTKDANYDMDIYAAAPKYTSWNKDVTGSQGLKQSSRLNQLVEEFERIVKYRDKGDLATFEELIDYLSKRK